MALEKTLKSPLDCKEIQPVQLKEISPGIPLERMMLKLKLQYFGYLMQIVGSLEKTLMLGGIGGRRIKPTSPMSSALEGRFFDTEPPGKPDVYACMYVCMCVFKSYQYSKARNLKVYIILSEKYHINN